MITYFLNIIYITEPTYSSFTATIFVCQGHFMKKHVFLLLIVFIFSQVAQATSFLPGAQYQTCFTPGQDCTAAIDNTIAQAKHSIYVQAYSFTARPIVKALVAAKQRGVKVTIILDKKSTDQDPHQQRTRNYLLKEGIPVWVDDKVNIAHNKVMIIDQEVVITGSFNFTWSAQQVNAENVLILEDHNLAAKYLKNWQNRLAQSTRIE